MLVRTLIAVVALYKPLHTRNVKVLAQGLDSNRSIPDSGRNSVQRSLFTNKERSSPSMKQSGDEIFT